VFDDFVVGRCKITSCLLAVNMCGGVRNPVSYAN
jgi:hypothetical protein